MKNLKDILMTLLLVVIPACALTAAPNSNATQARALFDKTFKMVFGSQGSSLHYKVNIIGIYKTEGTIWYKGKRSKFVEARYSSWNDGRTFYRADAKKKTVEIHNPNSEKKDKYMAKFKFVPDNYQYSWADTKEGRVILIDAKKGVSGSIKHVKVILNRKTGAPESLKIKVAFFWTTVKISNFRSGGINDNIFTFPRAKFKGYEFVDKRPD